MGKTDNMLGGLLGDDEPRTVVYVEEGSGPSKSPFNGKPSNRKLLIDALEQAPVEQVTLDLFGVNITEPADMNTLWDQTRIPTVMWQFAHCLSGEKNTALEMVRATPIVAETLSPDLVPKPVETALALVFRSLQDEEIFGPETADERLFDGAVNSLGMAMKASFESSRLTITSGEREQTLSGILNNGIVESSFRSMVRAALDGHRVLSLRKAFRMLATDGKEKELNLLREAAADRFIRETEQWTSDLPRP